MKAIGYCVVESCEDYEQVLALVLGGEQPKAGILDWPDGSRRMRTLFASHYNARQAITCAGR